VNSSGAANNNNANNAYGVAPDSVRRTTCRSFALRCARHRRRKHPIGDEPVNGRLDTPERTLLAWLLIALDSFMLVGVMRHIMQPVQWLSLFPGVQMPYKAFSFYPGG
jgi:hypothetical protein